MKLFNGEILIETAFGPEKNNLNSKINILARFKVMIKSFRKSN